ncbi:hypothetical protein [Mesorhizobium sp. B2-3-5]|uniref:hypothetical protein n=1 Tax=Mesorhizobium sp. B2-3-5 TaxID=2589958 RepID=UPI001129B6B6|nr:hypothetical protein [Mesorhizobium sp. B2-3-5]TPM26950.1 hypothetical protein FJ958_19110 [Mesorhizobium sp. B2-3-5]
MEFFLGAFEKEWERRRAALLHELQPGQAEEIGWDWRRRGGMGSPPQGNPDSVGRGKDDRGLGQVSLRPEGGEFGRAMRSRFAGLARGSQAAVVKLASYGGGLRVAAMISYASRSGKLAVENEKGELVPGKTALLEIRSEWEHLFNNRTASRDIGIFHIALKGLAKANGDRDEIIHAVLQAGFGERRFAYAVEGQGEELDVRGVLVLRDRQGERMTGDRKATAIVQQRFNETDISNHVAASFRFHGHGNGVQFATARIRELVERFAGNARDDQGRRIGTVAQAGDLAQKEWRKELHSRKGRDVMHLVISARAGTDETTFRSAVRDFLGDQFDGHRYVFAMHGPADDPKALGEGGKRPHVHAHAIVTMRSDTGARIETSPRVFREWRASMAMKARERGIEMELTDRRDVASAPPYSRSQVRPISYAGRTRHEGTSRAAQRRYDAKRLNQRNVANSDRSALYIAEVIRIWRTFARTSQDRGIAGFAEGRLQRIQDAVTNSQYDIDWRDIGDKIVKTKVDWIVFRDLIGGEEPPMLEMTRRQFEAYEQRVEAALDRMAASIEPEVRKDFVDIVAAAREVIDIRREHLEIAERAIGEGVYDREGSAEEPRAPTPRHLQAREPFGRSDRQGRDHDRDKAAAQAARVEARPSAKVSGGAGGKPANDASIAAGSTDRGGEFNSDHLAKSDGERAYEGLARNESLAAFTRKNAPDRPALVQSAEERSPRPDPSAKRDARLRELEKQIQQKSAREDDRER